MAEEKNQVEGIKLIYDFLKHIITLCTGSILLLSSFLPKLGSEIKWRMLAQASLVGLIISMVTCLLATTVIVLRAEEGNFKHTDGKEATAETVFFYTGAVCFFLAISSLAIFVGANLPARQPSTTVVGTSARS